MSQGGAYTAGTGAFPIEKVIGNSGGPVGPNAIGEINILGSGALDATGNPLTNTLTFSVDDASTTTKGVVRLSTDAETITGTSNTIAVTPASLSAKIVDATTTTKGIVRLSTDAETITGTSNTIAVTPASLSARLVDATTTTKGIVRLSTDAETIAGTSNTIAVTPASLAARLPSEVAFLAFNSVSDLNVTGNGAVATVQFDTEVFDVGGDFAANTFTAPVTGKYRLNASVILFGITAATTASVSIVTSNRTYTSSDSSPTAVRSGAGNASYQIAGLCDMDINDTATVTITSSGEVGDSNDILGAANPRTFFCGNLDV